MVLLEVGKKFPLPVPRKDGITPVVDGASLTFIVHAANVTPEEAETFQHGEIRYGVLDAKSIPVIFLDWPKFAGFGGYVNLRLSPPKDWEWFLSGDDDLLTLFFVNWRTGVLHGIRAIGSPPDYLAEIRKICRDSLTAYGTAVLLDKAAKAFFAKYSAKWIAAESRMIKSDPSDSEED
jgi:hypothetical protein